MSSPLELSCSLLQPQHQQQQYLAHGEEALKLYCMNEGRNIFLFLRHNLSAKLYHYITKSKMLKWQKEKKIILRHVKIGNRTVFYFQFLKCVFREVGKGVRWIHWIYSFKLKIKKFTSLIVFLLRNEIKRWLIPMLIGPPPPKKTQTNSQRKFCEKRSMGRNRVVTCFTKLLQVLN